MFLIRMMLGMGNIVQIFHLRYTLPGSEIQAADFKRGYHVLFWQIRYTSGVSLWRKTWVQFISLSIKQV
jgi:hypothetical protein